MSQLVSISFVGLLVFLVDVTLVSLNLIHIGIVGKSFVSMYLYLDTFTNIK